MRVEHELREGYGVLLVITNDESEPPQVFADSRPSVSWGSGCFAVDLPMQYGPVVIDIDAPREPPAGRCFWSHQVDTQQNEVEWTLTTLLGQPLARIGLTPKTSSRIQLAFEEGAPPVLRMQFEPDALEYVEAIEMPRFERLSPELEARLFPTEAHRPRSK
jgi:hypothetical protein